MEELLRQIRKNGGDLIGFADLQDLPSEIRQGLPCGISIAIALNPEIISKLEDGPFAEYEAEYERINCKLDKLTKTAVHYLQNNGHDAVSLDSTMYKLNDSLSTPLPHKTVALKAGIGWIGKCALLITPEYGSAVRLATVLTDIEPPRGKSSHDNRCNSCTNCIDACPGEAPSGKTYQPGMERDDFFNAFRCRDITSGWQKERGLSYNICGICINVCPWTRRYLREEGY